MKTFWNHQHPRYKESEYLFDLLVPVKGQADTLEGKILRAATTLYHDYYNNGNGNVIERTYEEVENICHSCDDGEIISEDDEGNEITEVCDDCGGSGCFYEEEESELLIDDFYESFFDLLEEHTGSDNIDKIKNFIINEEILSDDVVDLMYNTLICDVLDYIQKNASFLDNSNFRYYSKEELEEIGYEKEVFFLTDINYPANNWNLKKANLIVSGRIIGLPYCGTVDATTVKIYDINNNC